jgi:thiol:disulfide interchange protein
MDLQVWPQTKVVERVNSDFIPLEIDIDRSDAADVLKRFGVTSVPTILVLDQNGKQLARSGFADAEQLHEILKNAFN